MTLWERARWRVLKRHHKRETLWLHILVLKNITRYLIISVSMASKACITFYHWNIGQFASENAAFTEHFTKNIQLSVPSTFRSSVNCIEQGKSTSEPWRWNHGSVPVILGVSLQSSVLHLPICKIRINIYFSALYFTLCGWNLVRSLPLFNLTYYSERAENCSR